MAHNLPTGQDEPTTGKQAKYYTYPTDFALLRQLEWIPCRQPRPTGESRRVARDDREKKGLRTRSPFNSKAAQQRFFPCSYRLTD